MLTQVTVLKRQPFIDNSKKNSGNDYGKQQYIVTILTKDDAVAS